jgi:O-antigen/teichoic acid export membrane protein
MASSESDSLMHLEIKTIAKGGAIGMGGLLAAKFLAVAATPIITRILGNEVFGLYSLTTRLLEFLVLFFHFGFISSVGRFVAIYEGEKRHEYSRGVIAGTTMVALLATALVSCILVMKPELISIAIYKKPDFTPLVRIVAVALPFIVIATIKLQATIAKGTVIYLIFSEILVDPLKLAGVVIFCLLLGLGSRGAALSILLYTGARYLVASYGIRRCFPGYRVAFIRYFRFKEVFSYSVPLLLSSISVFAISQINILLGPFWMGNAAIGVYAVTLLLAFFGTLGAGSISTIFGPIIAGLYNEKKIDKLNELYQTTTRWAFHTSIMPLLFLAFKSESVLHLFGAGFARGKTAAMILCAGYAVSVSSVFSAKMLEMADRPWFLTINNLLMAGANVALCIILAPKYGMVGLAIAASVAIAGLAILSISEAWIVYGIHPFTIKSCKPVVPAILSAPLLLLHFHPWWFDLLVVGAIFTVTYFILSWFLSMEPEDRAIIKLFLEKIGIYHGNTSKEYN